METLMYGSVFSSFRGYIMYIVFFAAVILAIVCIAMYIKQNRERKKNNPVAPAPRCPLCGSKMGPRTYMEGDKKGQGYWQCTKAPECNGTAEMVYLNREEKPENTDRTEVEE